MLLEYYFFSLREITPYVFKSFSMREFTRNLDYDVSATRRVFDAQIAF